MRIALVSMHTSPTAVPGSGDAGGMNVVVAEAARALARRGHDVVAVTRATELLPAGEYPLGSSAHPDPSSARELRQPVYTPTLIALNAGSPDLRKEHLPGAIPQFAAALQKLGHFDAVHAHYWLSAVTAQEALAQEVPPRRGTQRGSSGHLRDPHTIVTTFHTVAALKNANLAPGDAPEPASRVTAEHRLAHQTFVVAGSRSELDAVHTHYGQTPVGSAVVHPGVNTDLFRPSAAESPAFGAARPVRVTVLGRVQPLKGQDLAVRAFGEFIRAYPTLAAHAELVIAGEPTPGAEPFAARLREIAAEYGLNDRIRFLPAQSREQAATLLASSTVALVPSHSETFGLTALEAAACGVPVIAGGHTGLLEAVPENIAAVHVQGRDPRDWAQALAGILADPHRRATLSASARSHALRHNWEAHARALEHIYSSLAQQST